MIKIFITFVLVSIPALLVYLNVSNPEVEGRFIFTLFVLIAMVERVWETFYTPKEKDVRKHRGDWSLIATALGYFLVSLLMVIHFYSTQFKTMLFVYTGLLLFALATAVRIYSIRTLGDNWSIHLIARHARHNVKKNKITKRGPYKYVRHPIYLAAIFELIGLSFITHSFFYLWIILFLNIPLFIWRALHEEKINIIKFGDEYRSYMREVSFMFPFKYFFNRFLRDNYDW